MSSDSGSSAALEVISQGLEIPAGFVASWAYLTPGELRYGYGAARGVISLEPNADLHSGDGLQELTAADDTSAARCSAMAHRRC
ncbi:hypothetical protein [Nocardia sp. NPDC005998]|uniref:hypothetical protein n=1 Tax=Nocardia sp. NPDC005998 TaxID=3156894 RepID=UPI0033A69D15